jgi:2-polyprenyl-6-methoxyphenol hydroxylase-like FAD-dependent oxidoreductase
MISKEPNNNDDLPIVIAGGGCVGLFLALLLTHSSLPNQIIVIEPQHPDPASTRAMAHQPPTFPLFAQIPDLLPELIKAGSLSEGLCFRTSVQNGSKVIASKKFDNSGEGMKGKGQLLLPQGQFQQILMGRLAKSEGKAEVRLGWSVEGFEQMDERVSVKIRAAPVSTPTLPYEEPDRTTDGEPDGESETETETIDASYLIGADGAHSLVRKAMGLELEGETLDAQLVATDLKFPFKKHGFFDANFIVDSWNYGLIGRIDNEGLWRVSYGVPGSQGEEEIRKNVHEKLRGMLPTGGRDEEGKDAFEVVRVAPYRAQQRCAPALVKGRVLLVGDAAHCKSPLCAISSSHTTNSRHSNKPLRRPRSSIWHCRRRLPRPHPRAHPNRQGVFALHTPLFLVRSPTTEVLRCGRQAESGRVQACEK